MLYPEMSIKEGVTKETLIGLASIRYGCSNLLYHGACTLTFFQCSYPRGSFTVVTSNKEINLYDSG